MFILIVSFDERDVDDLYVGCGGWIIVGFEIGG